MIDPDIIDLVFYSGVMALSIETIWWWGSRYRDSYRDENSNRPQIIVPALISAFAIAVALSVMVFISITLVWNWPLDKRLFWNPIARRIQGVALFTALASHWWWRIRR